MDISNWRNRPAPIESAQPRNVSFADRNGAFKGVNAATPSCTTRLKVPGRLSAYGKQPKQSFQHNPPLQSFKDQNVRSKASNWNTQRPEVLFNDHSEHLLKYEYKRGMIINAPVHEALSSGGKSRGPSHYESISAWGGVLTKPRYLIVVALHEKEYTCIPLYSHNHEGLRGKEHYRHEFVSIRDGRLQGKFQAQSDYPPLVTEAGTGPVISADSCAWLTHPVSRGYNLNLKICGRLKQNSLDHLMEYMEAAMRKGFGFA